MLRSLLLQLQVERKVKPPKCNVASLGITVHAEFSFRWNSFIQMDCDFFNFGYFVVPGKIKGDFVNLITEILRTGLACIYFLLP